jgi:putative phosphoesterase
MIIAVLSDTHLAHPSPQLAAAYDEYFRNADMVLHCGDLVGEKTWAFLNAHHSFHAVLGNCDTSILRGNVPILREVEAAGFRIGMAHGWGPRSRVAETVAAEFRNVDLICYGHTHIRDWGLRDGIWMLNPGSFSLPRDGMAGFALLTLEPGLPPKVEWITIGAR